MLPRHHPDVIHIAFDDHRLVNNAGLILPATLALHLGLPQLVDRHLDLGRANERGIHIGGQNPVNTIGSYLSLDDQFKNVGKGIWTLGEEPMAEIPSSDNDAASFSIGDISANTEEEPEISNFKQESKYAPR